MPRSFLQKWEREEAGVKSNGKLGVSGLEKAVLEGREETLICSLSSAPRAPLRELQKVCKRSAGMGRRAGGGAGAVLH